MRLPRQIKNILKGIAKIYEENQKKTWKESFEEEQNYNDCKENLNKLKL